MIVRRARPEEVPGLAALLGRAFVTEPVVRWYMDDGSGDADLAARLVREFAALDAVLAEHGLLWTVDGGGAAAVWVPPGQVHVVEHANAASRAAVEEAAPWGIARRDRIYQWIDARIPAEPLWFLEHVGVDPTHQGLGLGRSLVLHGLEAADADGVPAFLLTGTPRNVPYYERFGFAVVASDRAPDGGPEVWFMRRESR